MRMKKWLMLLIFVLTALLCACGQESSESANDVPLVYRPLKTEYQTNGELIRAEKLNRQSGVSGVELILKALESPSGNPELSRSMPEQVKIVYWSIIKGELRLELSEEYLELSGMEKTLTDYCVALSLLSAEGVYTVSIYVNGEPVSAGLSGADVLLYDSEGSPYENQIRLYFADSAGRYLIAEYHTLSVADDDSLERYIVDELLRGPNDDTLVSAIPEGTEFISVSTEDGLCTVRLSEEFYTGRPRDFIGERDAIYSIVNSLTSLAEVGEVRIEVEGMPSGRYLYMDLNQTFTRCDSVIGPVNSAKGEIDLDLYMAIQGLDEITAVPYIIERDEYLSLEECALIALTEAESEGAAVSLLYGCAAPNLVETRNGICRVDLPAGYFSQCEDTALAVDAMTATLCSLNSVEQVRITIDGELLGIFALEK